MTATSDEIKLKCPNCGSENLDDRASQYEGYWSKFFDYLVCCSDCNALSGVWSQYDADDNVWYPDIKLL